MRSIRAKSSGGRHWCINANAHARARLRRPRARHVREFRKARSAAASRSIARRNNNQREHIANKLAEIYVPGGEEARAVNCRAIVSSEAKELSASAMRGALVDEVGRRLIVENIICAGKSSANLALRARGIARRDASGRVLPSKPLACR